MVLLRIPRYASSESFAIDSYTGTCMPITYYLELGIASSIIHNYNLYLSSSTCSLSRAVELVLTLLQLISASLVDESSLSLYTEIVVLSVAKQCRR